MFGKFAAVSALGLAVLTLPQSCSQVDLGNVGDVASAFTLALDDSFGLKSGLRADEHPPPPPPDPCQGQNPPPTLCGESS